MIKNGLRPKFFKDHRNYSFAGTFGVAEDSFLYQELNYDAHLTMPDQTKETGMEYGCTGETTADIATDADGVVYDAKTLYDQTCELEGHGPEKGCYIENSLKTATVRGLKEKRNPKADPLLARRGQRFEIRPESGQDWFDALRSALVLNPKRSISVATPWFKQWNSAYVGKDGIMPMPSFAGDEKWHNWKICGIKQLNGEWFLTGKVWLGKGYGDNGFVYLGRATVNTMMIFRTEAWTQAKANANDIVRIQLDQMQFLLSYLIRLLTLQKASVKPPAPVEPEPVDTTPEPIDEPHAPPATMETMFDKFLIAMRDFEGKPGSLNYRNNNPLNFVWYAGGYAPKYGTVLKAGRFAKFETMELGMLYARNSIKGKIASHPEWTIYNYIALSHAPKEDGNDPLKYAKAVAARVGVDIDYPMQQIINS